MRTIWIPVVIGLMKKNEKLLVGQRPITGTLPGLWEFPGGKIETGENPIASLERELYEELDVKAKVGSPLLNVTKEVSYNKCILLLFYEVLKWDGSPRPQHHYELKWVSMNDLKTMDIPDTNKFILKELERKIFK